MGDNPEWVERRLALILTNLQRLEGRYAALKAIFPEWRDQRLLTIAMIEEFQQKLDSVFQSAIVANGVGSLASMIGTITSAIGVILSFKNGTPYDGVIAAGSRLATAGNITIPVVTLLEKGISSSYMRQVKSYVDIDQECSQPLREFLEDAENLDRLVLQVFGCSVYSDIFRDVITLCVDTYDLARNCDTECRRIGDMLRRRLRNKIPEDILEEIGRSLTRIFAQTNDMSGRALQRTLQRLSDLSREPTFVMTISCLRLYATANSLWKGESFSAAMMTKINWEKSSRLSITGHCLVDAASVLVDILHIISNVNGFMDGQSDYSKRLEQIKLGLQREQTTLENSILLNRV